MSGGSVMKVQLACLTLGLVKATAVDEAFKAIDAACALHHVPKEDCDLAKGHMKDRSVCSKSRAAILKYIIRVDKKQDSYDRAMVGDIVKEFDLLYRPTNADPQDWDDLELLKKKYIDIEEASTVLETAFVRLRYGYDQAEFMPFREFLESITAAHDDKRTDIQEKYFRAMDYISKASAWYFLKALHLRKRFPELPIKRAIEIIKSHYDDPNRVDVNDFIASYEITAADMDQIIAVKDSCKAAIAEACKENGIEDQSKTFIGLIEKETVDVRKDIMEYLVGMRNKAQIETCAESFGLAIDPSGDPVDKVEDSEAISLLRYIAANEDDLLKVVKIARLRHRLNLERKFTSIHAFLYAALFADDDQKGYWQKILLDKYNSSWMALKAILLATLQFKGGEKVDSQVEQKNIDAIHQFYCEKEGGSVINFIKKQAGARFQWDKSKSTLLITLRNGSTWKVVAEGMDMNTTDDKDEKKDDAKKSDNKSSDGGGSSGGGGGGGSGSGGSSGGGGGGGGSSSSSNSSSSSSNSSSTGASPSQSSTPSTDNSSAQMQVGWLLLAGVLAAM